MRGFKVIFCLAMLTAIASSTTTTTKANATETTTSTKPKVAETTYETYYWERCTDGKGSGPKGYQRLCKGEDHGECLGKEIGPSSEGHDAEGCADACTDTAGCGGFEYDTEGDDVACVLFATVTGVNLTKASHLNKHMCYFKEPSKIKGCVSEVLFSGRYKRQCDGVKHGQCRGTELDEKKYPLVDSAVLCAAECDRNSTCGGFEYDVHDESRHCYLYGEVTGAELPDWGADDWTHECYARVGFKPPSTVATKAKATTAGATKAKGTTDGATKDTETTAERAASGAADAGINMIFVMMVIVVAIGTTSS